MGNILFKSYHIFFGTHYIYTELLESKTICIRTIDAAYIAVAAGFADEVKQSKLFEPTISCMKCDTEVLHLELNRYKQLCIESGLYMKHLKLANELQDLYQQEQIRVNNIVATLIDKYFNLRVKPTHLARMERKGTKNKFLVPFLDMRRGLKCSR